MQSGIRRTTALWRHALLFGLLLALLELGLLVTSTTSSFLSLQQAILVGLLLYVAVPAFAEYMARSLLYDNTAKVWFGVRVGLASFSISLLATMMLFGFEWVKYANVEPPPHSWGIYDPEWEFRNLLTTLASLALIHGIGVLLSVVGSLLGGGVTIWRAARLQIRTRHMN
jgi:hypothetical protein